MTRRSRRRDSDSPVVPLVAGPLGLPAAPAGKPARRRTARLARTLRTRWWPRFLIAGVLLVILSATLLSGAVAAYVGLSGAATTGSFMQYNSYPDRPQGPAKSQSAARFMRRVVPPTGPPAPGRRP